MDSENGFSRLRFAAALLVGVVGSCFIWVAVPINNFLLNSNPIADSYIPEVVLALLSLTVLCINPLLTRINKAWRMTRRQLALVIGIWLMASVVPATGLLGTMPYSLAKANQIANTDKSVAEVYSAMDLPAALFPDKPEMGRETPVADGLLLGLKPDEPIPWLAWLRVAAAWAPIILGAWLMMIGLGMIVYPQWRERERLAFPLLTMYEALIETPEEGHHYSPILRSKVFWAGAMAVFCIHALNGISLHTNGAVPSIPLAWNYWWLFQDGVWRYAPWTLRGGHIYFILIGTVYFMPNRISLSLWLGIAGSAVYYMFCTAFFPGQRITNILNADFKAGAWVAYGLAIVWLGRSHWAQITRAMFSRNSEGTAVRDRFAGWLFYAGIAVMFAWFLWVGLSVGVSISYVLFGVLIALLAARVASEAGLPLFNFTPFPIASYFSIFPRGWWTAAAVYVGGYVTILFNVGARICASVMTCLSMGLDEDRPPREQPQVGRILLMVLVAGVFVAGATHLWVACRHEVALDGKTPISAMGRKRIDNAQYAAVQFHAGTPAAVPPAERWPNIAAGAVVATGLQAGCLASPRWPIHPIAFLFVGSQIGDAIWASIFVGWLLKTLITRYGGARGYRATRPLFLGLILGEVFAVIVWTIVPAVMILFGSDPATVGHLEILLSI